LLLVSGHGSVERLQTNDIRLKPSNNQLIKLSWINSIIMD